jgi:hypothetical protein
MKRAAIIVLVVFAALIAFMGFGLRVDFHAHWDSISLVLTMLILIALSGNADREALVFGR